jgi:hypothetical protein
VLLGQSVASPAFTVVSADGATTATLTAQQAAGQTAALEHAYPGGGTRTPCSR